MAPSHSSYTASPTRFQSPQRSPSRPLSQDGSQYEMDLDALGLNSTFESTELEHSHQPPVDRVDTSEIEGPEDFTMNMTYWMTADLPLAQIKSRKEANTKRPAARMDAIPDGSEGRQATEVGEPVVVVEKPRQQSNEPSRTASPNRRANGSSEERRHSKAVSERSMENDEKVRSFLSNLPDTEMDGALTGTPLHGPRRSFLQVPRSSPPKARSLQPTVEDYDTPRKPTLETVIRHTSAIIDTNEQDVARNKIAELQHQLEQQESSSRSRITELETILSYTRSELESTRAENYKHKEKLSSLEKSMQRQSADHDAARAAADVRLKSLEETERQRKNLEESNRQLAEEIKTQSQSLDEVQAELSHAKLSHEREVQDLKGTEAQRSDKTDENAENKRLLLAEQLSSVQARANALQSNLQTATAEAKLAREEAREKNQIWSAVEATASEQTRRIVKLEGELQNARFEVQCAKADAQAKQQLFQTNLDLNTRLRALQSELESTRKDSTGHSHGTGPDELEAHIRSLQSQLDSVRADNAAKDQQLQHTVSLETEVQSLRARITATGDDQTTNNGQSRQVTELEARIRVLQSELITKDEEMRNMIEKEEQAEHRINTYQGRLQSLEAGNANLRQQLAEAHRESAQARGDAERFERDLEDANDLLKEARAEADRRVSDIDKKLSKMKELKVEVETKFKELRTQHDDMIEVHDTTMEGVRDKAEDAVRKAGALLEQERSEKRRITRDLKRIKEEVETLRNTAAQQVLSQDDDDSTIDDHDTTTGASAMATNTQAAEITSLRSIIRTQLADIKALKSEVSALRKEVKTHKSTRSGSSSPTISTLESTISALRTENASLQSLLATKEADHEAVNKAMDEKLAALLSKVMKEKAKTLVGKRDGQWSESVRELESEREMLGKVVMRQWGREELGIEEEREAKDGKQTYRYKYAKRA
ncbi:hypothetical protein COCMIDRAFT_25040 [Bipolaris oryzae ATCC 44560]|uniref:Uncharacterized protein n=1 Tax=Bipolaris oryzae ATCC 44560 TaxID=930090 RepID=W6ZAH3_COCMI|nr:uncharacterized protein COCMIDRAFT_25040 [Bipolaris oryzae ATCC 44560]EUC46985.1 hypothetical protein COCMIDRAFT_25040 [Bipolaris oryzae ATCC 44560]